MKNIIIGTTNTIKFLYLNIPISVFMMMIFLLFFFLKNSTLHLKTLKSHHLDSPILL